MCNFFRQRVFAMLLVVVAGAFSLVSHWTILRVHEVSLIESGERGGAEPCGEILEGRTLTQPFMFQGTLSGIEVEMATYARVNRGELAFELKDETANEILVSKKIQMSEVRDNRRHLFDFGREVQFEKNCQYSFSLCGTKDCRAGNAVTCWATKATGDRSALDGGNVIGLTLCFNGTEGNGYPAYYVAGALAILLFFLFGDRFLLEAVQRPERVFLILGLFFCTVFLLLAPPVAIEDGTAHLLRSYQIGCGRLWERMSSKCSSHSADRWRSVVWNEEYRVITQKTSFHARYGEMTAIPYDFGRLDTSHPAMNYTPFAYIPQSVASFVARKANVSAAQGILLTSVACALAYLLCVWAVIGMVPCYKWFFLLLALAPTTFMHGISFSADSGIICFSFLFFGLFLKLAGKSDTYTWKDLSLLAVVAFAFCQCKFVYSPAIVVLFLLPRKNFGTLKRYLVFTLAVSAVSVLCGYLWNRGVSAGNEEYAKQVVERMDFIMTHPLDYLKEWGHVLFSRRSAEYAAQSIQSLGGRYFLSRGRDNIFIFDSFWMIYAGLVLSSLIVLRESEGNVIQRVFSLSAFIGSVSLIYLVFYAVSPDFIAIQGRYFTPLFPLLCLIFGQGRIGLPEKLLPYYKGGLVIWCVFSQIAVAESLLYTYWT